LFRKTVVIGNELVKRMNYLENSMIIKENGLLSRKWTPKNENVFAEIPTALSFGGALETINLKPRLIASNTSD
jgi:hypothetical protein